MKLSEINTAALENVIRIHGNVDHEKPPEIIDVNIKTNFTVSNSKRSKFPEKSLFILVFIFTGIFTIFLFNVRRELQALKSQEQCMENKIAILATKYEKVSSQLSRVHSHMNSRKYYQPLPTSDEYERHTNRISTSYSMDDTITKYNERDTVALSSSQNDQSDTLTSTIEDPDSIPGSGSENNSSFIRREEFEDSTSNDKYTRFNFKYNKMKSGNRFTRTILNATDENYQAMDRSVDSNMTDAEANFYTNKQNEQIRNDWENHDNIALWSEPRGARTRRDDERRGKIRTKKKRRPNRSRRRLGPLVATFIGGIPEQHITDTGAIGPWVKINKNISHYDLQKFHIVENKKAIEITMNGLYMVSTQIFYFGRQTNFSYWILLSSEGQSTMQRVTKCSAVLSTAANEVSCHTTVVLPLWRGDRLHVQQQEHDRLINLREGHSFVQLVLLSDESQSKYHVV